MFFVGEANQNQIVASWKEVVEVLGQGSAEEIYAKYYNTYGSDLCSDLASVSDCVKKILDDVNFWKVHYLVVGDNRVGIHV